MNTIACIESCCCKKRCSYTIIYPLASFLNRFMYFCKWSFIHVNLVEDIFPLWIQFALYWHIFFLLIIRPLTTAHWRPVFLIISVIIESLAFSLPPIWVGMNLVQSLNSPFFPPQKGAEPGREKEESRITCMRMLRTPPFSPQIGEKTYLEVFSRFGLWRDFLNDNIQATISVFRLIKNMSINPRSVEFHQCHAKPHSICYFFNHIIKDNERNLCQDLLTIENTDPESARAALCKWATCMRQTFLSKPFTKSLNVQRQYEKMFGKRVMTRTRCR